MTARCRALLASRTENHDQRQLRKEIGAKTTATRTVSSFLPHLSPEIVGYKQRLVWYHRNKVAKLRPKPDTVVKIACVSGSTRYRYTWSSRWNVSKRASNGYLKATFLLYPSDFLNLRNADSYNMTINRYVKSRYFQHDSCRTLRRMDQSNIPITIVGKVSLRRFRVSVLNKHNISIVSQSTNVVFRRIGFVDQRPTKGKRNKSMNRLIIR